MARFLEKVRTAMREAEDIRTVQEMPVSARPIVTYVEDVYTWNQLEGYLTTTMTDYGRPIVYLTSDPDDPRFSERDALMSTFLVRDRLAKFLPALDSPVFFTTMPDLDTFHVKRPERSTCVYAFHSLNSTHMTYRRGAFDAYDVFFCVGPYHERELAARFSDIGKEGYDLIQVGYYKLDRVSAAYRGFTKAHPDRTTVLIAPSWGPDNLLAIAGQAVIASVAAEGVHVVVRPHPAFFESVYPEGRDLVHRLAETFAATDNVEFETSIVSENSFMEADVMISDWSGASFEFALGTERPVLFVDVPRKAFNPQWEDLGITPFEDRMRGAVGRVLPVEDASQAGAAAAALIHDPGGYRDRIIAARAAELFNFGGAAAAGGAALDRLAP